MAVYEDDIRIDLFNTHTDLWQCPLSFTQSSLPWNWLPSSERQADTNKLVSNLPGVYPISNSINNR